jgi:hypothetical protein
MSDIVLVDTSVLLNVLDVPGRNQNRKAVLDELGFLVDAADHLFIPMAAIIEVGNHIAHIAGDGRLRRQAAERFVTLVREALGGIAPWRPMNFPSDEHLLAWLADFPDCAMRQMGMGDLSIQKEWAQLCGQYPMTRVRIWALDGHLAECDRLVDK